MQSRSTLLSAYHYALVSTSGREISNADILSCLLFHVPDLKVAPPVEVLVPKNLPDTYLWIEQILRLTGQDATMTHFLNWVWRGLSLEKLLEKFKPFRSCQHEQSAHKWCLLWGNHAVIVGGGGSWTICPHCKLQNQESWSYAWCPGINLDIEKTIDACNTYQALRYNPPRGPSFCWEVTKKPWSRILQAPSRKQTYWL